MLLAVSHLISGGSPASPGLRQYIFHSGKRFTCKPMRILEGVVSNILPNRISNLTKS